MKKLIILGLSLLIISAAFASVQYEQSCQDNTDALYASVSITLAEYGKREVSLKQELNEVKEKNADLEFRIAVAESRLLEKNKEISTLKNVVESSFSGVRKVNLTAYTLSKDECSASLVPYLGDEAKPGETVGVSRDLKSWLGRYVYIDGFGVRRVNDLMAPHKKNQIDILVSSKKEAREKVGLKKGVSVILLTKQEF